MGAERAPRTEVLLLLRSHHTAHHNLMPGDCQQVQAVLQLTPYLLFSSQSQSHPLIRNMAQHANAGHTCCILPFH